MTAWTDERRLYCQPILLALSATGIAVAIYFVIFGILLNPVGAVSAKAVWAISCAIGMGAVIGSITVLLVADKTSGTQAIVIAAIIGALIPVLCTGLCLLIDQNLNFFGGLSDPDIFVWSGLIAALVFGPTYGWLLYSEPGQTVLQSAGL